MATKSKRKVDSDHHAIPLQHQADEKTVCHKPSHEEIRLRAYEIYLERGSHSGDELDDWLRAERELQKVALFERDWNRIQQRVAPIPETKN